MNADLELFACSPVPVSQEGFNTGVILPYGCTTDHIQQAMSDFTDFLGFVNSQLHQRNMPRLESMLMPANFSSIVGEFMTVNLPKYCSTLVKNRYHNGHPDLIPTGRFPNDMAQHSSEGIEVKASRYFQGWQGHNPEDVWLMVFVFDANGPRDDLKNVAPKPFRFVEVLGAHLTRDDWVFSGRSETSRRTITASVTRSGYRKMAENWIYRSPTSS